MTVDTDAPVVDTSIIEKVAKEALNGAAVATFAALRAKPRRTITFPVNTVNEEGVEVVVTVKYRALPSNDYDELQAAHPPTAEQKRNGQIYNVDTFAPALISAVSWEPKMTVDEAREIYTSPDWSGGELSTMLIKAMQVCNAGLDVPFNARD